MTKIENTSGRLISLQSERLGWIGILHQDETITEVKFGYDSQAALIRQFDDSAEQVYKPNRFETNLLDMFESYANGEPQDFNGLRIDESWMTPFQRKVIQACREISHGETASYGLLASRAGSPRAARAVGTVMSNNRCPLVVPCHRVVGSGSLGGFSSHRGLSMKQILLGLEAGEPVGAC